MHEPLTSYKFYYDGIADVKVIASNLALNVSIGNRFEIPNKICVTLCAIRPIPEILTFEANGSIKRVVLMHFVTYRYLDT